MNFDALLALSASIIILLTGFRVWLLDTHRHQYRVFFILCLLLSWMSFGWYEMAQTTELAKAQFWRRSQAIWTFITPLIFYMIYVFADDKIRRAVSNRMWQASFALVFGLGIFFFILEVFTSNGHGQVTWLDAGVWSLNIDRDSPFHIIRAIWTLICYLPAIIVMYFTYRAEKIRRHRNWKLAIVAILIIGLVGTTLQNYIFPYFDILMPINESGSTLAATMLFGWAMSDFKLFDYDTNPSFEELAKKMPDLILLTNTRWRVQKLNPMAAQFFGQSEVLKKPLRLNELLPQELARDLEQKIIKEGQGFDIALANPTGEIEYYHFSGSPVRNRRGDTIGHLLLGSNMTSYHQALQASEANALKLAQSNEALERFAYIASHDMKEPARTIGNFVGLLRRRLKDHTSLEVEEHLQFLEKSSHRLHQVIESILDFSRLSKHSAEAKQELIDTNQLLREVLDDMQHILQSQHALVLVGPLPFVMGKSSLLKLLFSNLISNGIKFNRSAEPEIHISCRTQEGRHIFSIRDNGIGIAPEFQGRIFEMFRRLHAWSNIEGTGIGLSICKRIVEDAGGQIWVESDGKRGASFYFTILPVISEEVTLDSMAV